MPLTAGTRLGAYEIVASLGAGGMGEVYRAKDLRLGREIALKVLPAGMSASPDRLARFEREARTVAALNHPNIVTLHSVEDDGGVRFITMELVEGRSLNQALASGGLPVTRVVELGIALADALAAAHEQGVVHRDLKPANVMLTRDGRVKVLDFGLAKLASPDSDPGLTDAPTLASPLSREGQVVGTVPYMAPEQLRGEAVDARTDLFALGIVLYELATGTRPFTGATPADISSAILRDAPRPLTDVRADLPADLQRLVGRCLEKNPRERYQTAIDVSNDLRRLQKELTLREAGLPASAGSAPSEKRSAVAPAPIAPSRSPRGLWIGLPVIAIVVAAAAGYFVTRGRGPAPARHAAATAPAPAPEHSIAVLPFTDLSPGKDQGYFSDGISEELLNLLARIPELQVIARTSSFSFRGKDVAIPEIARRLNVRHVLEGSVQKVGNRVRISAQLVDAATDTPIWSQRYDRTLHDVFAIQDEIAADVVEQLKVRMLGTVPKLHETTPEAYALFLQATQIVRTRSAQAYAQSDSILKIVLAMDPGYVPAWTSLANDIVNEVTVGLLPADQGYPRAREAANRALAIDPDFARAHASLGLVAMFSGDLPGAAQHFERALALDPADLIVLGNSSAVLKSLGRLKEAVAMDEAMVRRDPVNSIWMYNLGCAQNWAGRHNESEATMRTVLSVSPEYIGAHLVLGEALMQQGRKDEALAEIRQESLEAFRRIGLSLVFHALGRKTDADTALAALIAKNGNEVPYDIAYIYAMRGEPDHAFEWLDKAAAAHDPSFILILVENFFDPLHSDPRWLPFLRRIGKDPAVLAKIPFKVATGAAS